ncbi:MAG: hypothetical protein U0802_22680 [Candidatus Binatia bacterium]
MSATDDAGVDLRRLLGAAGLYAGAALAQRGVGLLLLPLYTRALPPAEYGMLELFNTFAAVVGTLLALGLASAMNKVLHADCETPAERQSLLVTALAIDLPVLMVGAVLLVAAARPLAAWMVGDAAAADCVWLIAGQVVAATLWTLAVAMLRAQERALAFGALNLAQFALTAAFNVVLVAGPAARCSSARSARSCWRCRWRWPSPGAAPGWPSRPAWCGRCFASACCCCR